jgi:2-phosphoglycerate kinase
VITPTQTDARAARGWQVHLLGGASGVGKSSVASRLAHHYGVGLTEVDDFQVVLDTMTTPEQQPVLHYWRTHREEWRALDEDGRLAYTLRYAAVMAQALEQVIANHLEGAPVVLEGDFIVPELATRIAYGAEPAAGRVRAVFLYEADEAQIARNYQEREGRDQAGRARASWHYSEWLREGAALLGVPSVPARPWETVLERVIAAVDGAPRL